jgi:tetrahydromethanopterin S-methyltransferase subunit F
MTTQPYRGVEVQNIIGLLVGLIVIIVLVYLLMNLL